MRKLILTATGFLCLAGGSYVLGTAWGQDIRKPPKEAAEDVPHRVGLVDIDFIFANYDKLKFEREDLIAEAKEAQAKLVEKNKKGQELQAQLANLKEGSADYEALQTKLFKKAAELETERKMLQGEFQKKEAKVFHMVYLEIQDAVEKFCNQYKFTVIIRFNRTDASSTDPRRVQQLMSQAVVYHRNKDDLSEGVLKYLNEKYRKSAGGEARPVTDTSKKAAKAPKKDDQLKQAGGER